MEIIGNLFTHYNYTTTDIRQTEKENTKEIESLQSKFKVIFSKTENHISLPGNSPFADWKEARRFAGPLPFTFTYDQEKKEVLIIEGVRQNWIPQPLEIISYQLGFLNTLPLTKPILANAFIIKNIPYYWKKGKTESWK